MSRSQTTDLSAQIGQQRDRLTESVGAIADKIDVSGLTDKIDVSGLADKIDTDAIRAKAEAGASDLLEHATDDQGRPKKGLLVGLVLGVVALLVVRRLAR